MRARAEERQRIRPRTGRPLASSRMARASRRARVAVRWPSMATVPLTMVRPSRSSAEAEHDGPEVRVRRSSRRPPVVTTTTLSHVDDPLDELLVEVEVDEELELVLLLVVDPLVVLVACAVRELPPARGGSAAPTTHPPIATGAMAATGVRETVVAVSFMSSV